MGGCGCVCGYLREQNTTTLASNHPHPHPHPLASRSRVPRGVHPAPAACHAPAVATRSGGGRPRYTCPISRTHCPPPPESPYPTSPSPWVGSELATPTFIDSKDGGSKSNLLLENPLLPNCNSVIFFYKWDVCLSSQFFFCDSDLGNADFVFYSRYLVFFLRQISMLNFTPENVRQSGAGLPQTPNPPKLCVVSPPTGHKKGAR